MAARSRRQALKWIAGASAIMLAPQAMQFASAAEEAGGRGEVTQSPHPGLAERGETERGRTGNAFRIPAGGLGGAKEEGRAEPVAVKPAGLCTECAVSALREGGGV